MSQWGEPRTFSSSTASIKVLPDVYTGEDPYNTMNLESKIWRLSILDAKGDEAGIRELTAQVQQYIGKPYAEWCRRIVLPENVSLNVTGPFVAMPPGHVPFDSNTTGAENVAVGSNALYNNTTGGSNVAIRAAGLMDVPPCIIRQFGDMTMCVKPGCHLQWDTNDPEPPVCPTRAVAVQRRSVKELSQAQKRLSALYSEPGEGLWGILGKWAAGLAIVAAIAVLIGGVW